MCVPLTFACFFAALVPYKWNGGAGAVQQQPGIHSSNIIPNSATDYTCCCCCCCQCRSSFADRDYIKRTLPHSDDATRTTHHVPMRHKYFAKLGGWLLGEGGRMSRRTVASSCTRMRVDLSSLCMAMSLSLPVLLCDWTFPHYGVINIQYTFYKILYLDNICALCRLSCAPLW